MTTRGPKKKSKIFVPVLGSIQKPLVTEGFVSGVVVIQPRPYIRQHFHAPTEEDRNNIATHILYWLRKKVKYFHVPKPPEPLDFDILDIASYPEYLRETMSLKALAFTEKEKAHVYWKNCVKEIDMLLLEGTYLRSPWELLLSVYEKASFHSYEKVENTFNLHPLVEPEAELFD